MSLSGMKEVDCKCTGESLCGCRIVSSLALREPTGSELKSSADGEVLVTQPWGQKVVGEVKQPLGKELGTKIEHSGFE